MNGINKHKRQVYINTRTFKLGTYGAIRPQKPSVF